MLAPLPLAIVVFLAAVYRTELATARAITQAMIRNREVRCAYFRGHGDGYDLGFMRGFEAGKIAALAQEQAPSPRMGTRPTPLDRICDCIDARAKS